LALVRRARTRLGREHDRWRHRDKSISIDSLYKVSVALGVPLGHLADVQPGRRVVVPSADAQKIFALVTGTRRPVTEMRRAYEMLRQILDKG
jgi:hypothetical protein